MWSMRWRVYVFERGRSCLGLIAVTNTVGQIFPFRLCSSFVCKSLIVSLVLHTFCDFLLLQYYL